MKHKRILSSSILALALLSAMPCALAQSSGVPNAMTYQGRIGDAAGNLVGSPAPVNRTITFRIWDSATASAPANLLYSEQQIVTISGGEFNVLIGQGLQVGTEPKPAFDSVFDGAQRFLGVTVDDGTAANDPEIAPRQQLHSLAFAFRAKTAEALPNNAITSSMLAAGAVTPNSIAAAAIDSTKLATGAVTAPTIAAASIDSSKLANGSVTTASIAAGAIDSSKLAAGAVTTASIPANAINGSKLSASAVTNAAIPDNTIASSKLIAASVTSDKLSLPGLWSAAGGNVSRPTGRVGIATASPERLLHVNEPNRNATTRGENLRMTGVSRNATDVAHGIFMGIGITDTWIRTFVIGDTTSLAPTNSGVRMIQFGLRNLDNVNYIDCVTSNEFFGNNSNRISLNPFGGNIGIGLFNPTERLHVNGDGRFFQNSNAATVFASSFSYSSDARVKSMVARSKPAEDLELIRKLQVTDYRMIGGNAAGDAVQKGFIAQEVREIMPEAVTESRNSLIPNINAPATNVTYDSVSKTLRIVLEKAHGLQQGDTVQLQGDKRSLEVKVSETINATTFIAGPVEAPISEVFVHGKKVDDFLSVDYKRIFTAGIGAIQHLAGQVDAIKAERAVRPARITDGERRFAELEASDQTCNARLDAIENMLNSSGGAVVTAAAENKQGAN